MILFIVTHGNANFVCLANNREDAKRKAFKWFISSEPGEKAPLSGISDAFGSDTCNDPGCPECYSHMSSVAQADTVDCNCGNSNYSAEVAPDEQARAEVHANLNKDRVDMVHEVPIEWEDLYEDAEQELAIFQQLVDRWRDRAFFLESAVKTYASHAWNDIQNVLKEHSL